MMAAGKFKLNKATIAMIAKSDPKLAQAVDDIADRMAGDAGPNARVDHYTTDRHVAGIVVPPLDQARDGALTKAVGKHGGRIRGRND